MMISKILTTLAATALVAAPVAAAPVPAGNLSVAKAARSGSAAIKKNELAGGGFIIAILAVVAVGAGIYVAVDSDDDASDSN
jgi:hypothetical protein